MRRGWGTDRRGWGWGARNCDPWTLQLYRGLYLCILIQYIRHTKVNYLFSSFNMFSHQIYDYFTRVEVVVWRNVTSNINVTLLHRTFYILLPAAFLGKHGAMIAQDWLLIGNKMCCQVKRISSRAKSSMTTFAGRE